MKRGTLALSLAALLLSTLIGCSTTIPYPQRARLDSVPPEQRLGTNLTVRMSEELYNHVASIKPAAIGTSYTLAVGESIRANLTNALSPLFNSTQVSTQSLTELKGRGTVIDVELNSFDFDPTKNIFGSHDAKLAMQYHLYDDQGAKLTTISTDTSGTSGLTANEKVEHLFPAFATGYQTAMGRAYDQALQKSIDELLNKLKETLIHE